MHFINFHYSSYYYYTGHMLTYCLVVEAVWSTLPMVSSNITIKLGNEKTTGTIIVMIRADFQQGMESSK